MEILREGKPRSRAEVVQRVVKEVREKEGDIGIPDEGVKRGTEVVRGVLEGGVEVRVEEEKGFWD